MSEAASHLHMSLDDAIKKDKKDVKMSGDNKGGKGGKFRNKQGGRPRHNDSKNNTRSNLFKPQKTGNQISKERGERKPLGGNRGGKQVGVYNLVSILTLFCTFCFCLGKIKFKFILFQKIFVSFNSIALTYLS